MKPEGILSTTGIEPTDNSNDNYFFNYVYCGVVRSPDCKWQTSIVVLSFDSTI